MRRWIAPFVHNAADWFDHGECPTCGAPPEDVHDDACWRRVFDAVRLWAERKAWGL